MAVIPFKPPEQMSALEWLTKQLEDSSIPKNVADHAGLSLQIEDPIGLKILYHDIRGAPIDGYWRLRRKEGTVGGELSGNYGKQTPWKKYTQPYGTQQLPYWPRVKGVDHSVNLNDISIPLFIVEGEKKALSLQVSLLASGIQASCVGVPGVMLSNSLLENLSSIPHRVGDDERRVFVCFDWNDEGQGELDTRKAEARVTDHVVPYTTNVVNFRWPAEEEGVQKIDDWIAAGGKVDEAVEYSVHHAERTSSEHMKVLMQFNEDFCVVGGKICLGNTPMDLVSSHQFHIATRPRHYMGQTATGRPKKCYYSELWLDWGQRSQAAGFIFTPPPIGEPPRRFVDGFLNVAPRWPDSPPWADDFTPFEDLLRSFCESADQYTWLRMHIAHAARRPASVCSNAVVLADQGGTGKGLLFRTLSKMFGAYSTLIKDELTGRFNGGLAGAVIGLYDEPDRDRFGVIDLDKSTKRVVGNPTLVIEGKGTMPITVRNYLRLFISTNLDYVAPVSRQDRRWNYFTAGTKMSPQQSEAYVKWLDSDPNFGAWCHDVDIDGYAPTVLGPESAGRAMAQELSMSIYEEFLQWEELERKDVWSNENLFVMFQQFQPQYRGNAVKFGIRMSKYLPPARSVKVKGTKVKMRSIRHHALWGGRSGPEWLAEYLK